MSQHEAWYVVKPSAKEMYIWGCLVLVAYHDLKKSQSRVQEGLYYGVARSHSMLLWFDDTIDNCEHAQGARLFELDTTAKKPTHGQFLLQQLHDSNPPTLDIIDTQEYSIDIGDRAHYDTEPIVVHVLHVVLPPYALPLE
jgi:hypothetical protein